MKIILAITAILLYNISTAQTLPEAEVPTKVTAVINKEYSGASNVVWSLNRQAYAVEFEINDLSHHMLISDAGQMLMHSQEILYAALPAAVAATLDQHYGDGSFGKMEKIEENDTAIYFIQLQNSTLAKTAIIAEDGRLHESAKGR